MADNITVTPGSGATISADDVGAGVLVQRTKTTWGPDGTANDTDVASGKPMPVQLRGSDGTDRSNALPVTLASTTITGTAAVTQSGTWSNRVTDGTNTAAVKAASTAPVATDPAFVVALSPNGLNANGQTTMTNSAPVAIASDQTWPVGTVGFAKAEDVASASGDLGIPAMAIQQSSPADTAANADYAMLQMSAGRLWASVIVTAAAASIGKAEDVASADADVGVPAMVVRKATPANVSGSDGDYEFLQASAGSLWVASVATDKTLVSERVITGGSQYEAVAASQTTQTLGPTGAVGDYLECLTCVVATAATSQVQIKDGANTAITVLPNAVGAGVGTYTIPLGLISTNGAWQVTTAAGVSVIGSGRFT